jgi:hypothetical protein
MLAGLPAVLPTQETIEDLADRIERAYALRRAHWYRGCSTRRVWSAAALCLWQATLDDTDLPLDVELFVASQPLSDSQVDPWMDLAQPEAGRRYRRQVHRIISRLRLELTREVRHAERRMQDAQVTPSTLSRDPRLSPLGCFIAAHRNGRAEWASHFAVAAARQHHACPLYQIAFLSFLPPDRYPLADSPPAEGLVHERHRFRKSIVMN